MLIAPPQRSKLAGQADPADRAVHAGLAAPTSSRASSRRKLGERLKQQLVVENRVGASGNMGTEAVARAEPDGYTIGLANTSTHAVTASVPPSSATTRSRISRRCR